jgi:hypothetical protein
MDRKISRTKLKWQLIPGRGEWDTGRFIYRAFVVMIMMLGTYMSGSLIYEVWYVKHYPSRFHTGSTYSSNRKIGNNEN